MVHCVLPGLRQFRVWPSFDYHQYLKYNQTETCENQTQTTGCFSIKIRKVEHCKSSNFINQETTAKPTDLGVNESESTVTDSLAFPNNPHRSGSSQCALHQGHTEGGGRESNILLWLPGECAHIATHTHAHKDSKNQLVCQELNATRKDLPPLNQMDSPSYLWELLPCSGR